jgi:hypothetical protein
VIGPYADAPIVLYDRAPGGEYQVYLAAKDKRGRSSYEFSMSSATSSPTMSTTLRRTPPGINGSRRRCARPPRCTH